MKLLNDANLYKISYKESIKNHNVCVIYVHKFCIPSRNLRNIYHTNLFWFWAYWIIQETVQSYLNVLHFYACKLPLPTFLSFFVKSDSQKNLFAINVIKFALKYEIWHNSVYKQFTSVFCLTFWLIFFRLVSICELWMNQFI